MASKFNSRETTQPGSGQNPTKTSQGDPPARKEAMIPKFQKALQDNKDENKKLNEFVVTSKKANTGIKDIMALLQTLSDLYNHFKDFKAWFENPAAVISDSLAKRIGDAVDYYRYVSRKVMLLVGNCETLLSGTPGKLERLNPISPRRRVEKEVAVEIANIKRMANTYISMYKSLLDKTEKPGWADADLLEILKRLD